MKWTEDKLDVLQNLEFSIVEVWRAHPEMTDYTAHRAYEAAFQLYRAEQRGHPPKRPTLTGLDAAAFESLQAMCEFRLGRRADSFPDAGNIPAVPVEQIVDYLRELARSVERHTKIDGRQGYLSFIDKFLP